MARRTRKQMEGNKYEDKLIERLKQEFGLSSKQNNNKSKNVKGGNINGKNTKTKN